MGNCGGPRYHSSGCRTKKVKISIYNGRLRLQLSLAVLLDPHLLDQPLDDSVSPPTCIFESTSYFILGVHQDGLRELQRTNQIQDFGNVGRWKILGCSVDQCFDQRKGTLLQS